MDQPNKRKASQRSKHVTVRKSGSSPDKPRYGEQLTLKSLARMKEEFGEMRPLDFVLRHRQPFLLVNCGEQSLMIVPLPEDQRKIVIGNSFSCELFIPSRRIAPYQAKVFFDRDSQDWCLEVRGSSPKVTPLEDGAVFVFEDVTIKCASPTRVGEMIFPGTEEFKKATNSSNFSGALDESDPGVETYYEVQEKLDDYLRDLAPNAHCIKDLVNDWVELEVEEFIRKHPGPILMLTQVLSESESAPIYNYTSLPLDLRVYWPISRSGKLVSTIGRNPDCRVMIRSDTISRAHARIGRRQGQWEIEDLKSANGTFVDRAPITTSRLEHKSLVSISREVNLLFLAKRELTDMLEFFSVSL